MRSMGAVQNLSKYPKPHRQENWRIFKFRGAVDFTNVRTRCCPINRMIIPWLKDEEILRLVEIRATNKKLWKPYCLETIEPRLKAEGIV